MISTLEGEILLQAIISDPDDDLARLAYADWLEETGDTTERAEFIRIQIELSQANEKLISEYGIRWQGIIPIIEGHSIASDRGCRVAELMNRSRELWSKYCYHWAETLPAPEEFHPMEYLGSAERHYERGFIHTVECTLRQWWEDGKSIVKKHPIQKVRLNDKQVDVSADGMTWYGKRSIESAMDHDDIPTPIYHLLKAGDNHDDLWYYYEEADLKDRERIAEEDLSQACIRWAKGEQ